MTQPFSSFRVFCSAFCAQFLQKCFSDINFVLKFDLPLLCCVVLWPSLLNKMEGFLTGSSCKIFFKSQAFYSRLFSPPYTNDWPSVFHVMNKLPLFNDGFLWRMPKFFILVAPYFVIHFISSAFVLFRSVGV